MVESTKAVSDLYAPVSGTVGEVNDTLLDNPELINEDPYEDWWMIRIAMSDQSELGKLMDAAEYATFIEEEKGKEADEEVTEGDSDQPPGPQDKESEADKPLGGISG